jgi:hypothetical protein
MRIEQLTSAEPGWKAVFKEPDGSESVSRILGWAVLGDDGEIAGVIVDPAEPSRIVPAREATSPGGGEFSRYRFVAPEPIVIQPPAPKPPEAPRLEDAPEQLAKGLLKRKR